MRIDEPYDRAEHVAKFDQIWSEATRGQYWGRINLYVCEDDESHYVYTIDRVRGTTPFLISCDACDGLIMMQSRMYRVPQNVPEEHLYYEWDFPTNEEFEKLDPLMQQHVLQGGLIKRRLNLDLDPRSVPRYDQVERPIHRVWFA